MRLRAAERLRRFTDDAPLELRTPIAAIAGYAELYDTGGIEAGPGLDRGIGISRSPLDISALVAEIAEDSCISTGRNITSDVPDRVMVNPASTPIELVFHRAADEVQLLVVDHGSGIPESERQRVFDRFARPDTARDRTHGGAGLGLAIVREVVLSHDGEVVITETPGGRATVQITLPLVSSES
jgi:two-component system OmpR family sensor kinase